MTKKATKRDEDFDNDDDDDTSEEMFATLMSARDVAVSVLGTRSPEVVRALFVVMPGDDEPEEFEDFIDDLKRSARMAADLYGPECTPLAVVGVYEDVFADLDEND